MLRTIAHLFGFQRKRRPANGTPVRRFRPWLERLEERDVPANAFWVGDSMVDLNWSTDSNWLNGFKPGASDSVFFDENAVNDCAINSDVSVADLYISTGFGNRKITLTDTDIDLNVTKSLFMNAGQIIGGDLTVSGGTFDWWGGTRRGTDPYNDLTTISTKAVLQIRGNVELISSTLNNYGTINLDYIANAALNLPEAVNANEGEFLSFGLVEAAAIQTVHVEPSIAFELKMLVDARLINKDGSYFNNLAGLQTEMTIHSDAAAAIHTVHVEPSIAFELKMLVDARLINKDGSYFNNLAGLQTEMTIHSDATFTEFAIDKGATFTHSNSFLSIGTSLFNNAGSIKLYEHAGMVVSGEGTLGGGVSLATDSAFFINPYGNLTFVLDNVAVTGEGILGYSDSYYGSRLEIKGTNTIQNFVQSGGYGNIAGDGTLNISGTFDWIGGGTWTGNVTVNIMVDAVLNIVEGEGGTTFYLWNGSSLSNSGKVNWDSGLIVSGNDSGANTASARIYNAEGAVFDVQGDLTLLSQYAPLAFVNEGTVMKSQGEGLAYLDLTISGSGTLETASGTLLFNESIS